MSLVLSVSSLPKLGDLEPLLSGGHYKERQRGTLYSWKRGGKGADTRGGTLPRSKQKQPLMTSCSLASLERESKLHGKSKERRLA